MKNQIVSEIRKLRTTRSAWGLLTGSLGLVALGVVGVLWESTPASLTVPLAARSVTHVALSVTWVFVLILGLRSFTDEFRNGSIVPTLLADPHRRQVLWAKLVAMAAAAAVFTVAAATLTFAIAIPWIAAKGIALDIGVGPLAVWFGKLFLIDLLFATIGVGVGLAVRHQVAAIVGSIVLVTIVEDLLSGLAPKLAPYFPTAGVWSIAGFGGAFMSPAGGALVLGAWAAGAVGLGAALMERRDIA
jgi:ABC-type transport system involved in multi-copper enzyme maturation permease subunit